MASNLKALRIPGSIGVIGMSVALSAVGLVGCSGDEAVPIDPANPPVLDAEPPAVTHSITATPEMEELARQQCFDDPSLEEGYVEAVDPDTDQVLAEVAVDCDAVRSDG